MQSLFDLQTIQMISCHVSDDFINSKTIVLLL